MIRPADSPGNRDGSADPDAAADAGSGCDPRAHREAADSEAAGAGPEPLVLPAGVHHLCSCGRSRHGWICDGAHLGSGRVSYELQLDTTTTVLLCRCGRSHRYPLCDGRHRTPRPRPWWPWRRSAPPGGVQ